MWNGLEDLRAPVLQPNDASVALFHDAHANFFDQARASDVLEHTQRLLNTTEPTYKGEGVKIAVFPATYVCAGHEQFGEIARRQLGANASDADVSKYVTEVARLNNIDDPAKHQLRPGETLKLPGHKADGTLLTASHLERKIDQDGTITIRAEGRRPEENFSIRITKDKQLTVYDGDGNKLEFSKDAAICKQREHLLDLASKNIKSESELAKFVVDLARFENRAAAGQLPVSEVAATYKQVERIMSDSSSHLIQQTHKTMLAEQIISQSATPTSVEQGGHPTCNVANVESRMYTRKPSEAARFVVDLALTSHYVTANGIKVDYDGRSLSSLVPHNESRTNPPVDAGRSYASQIFQMGAVTAAWNGKAAPGNSVRYEDAEQKNGIQQDRLIVYGFGQSRVLSASPELGVDRLEPIYNGIAGTNEHGFVMQRSAKDIPGAVGFNSATELERHLTEANNNKLYPVIVMVDTSNQPFAHDEGIDKRSSVGGAHVVSVTDFDNKTKMLSVDGTWASSADHLNDRKLSVKDMYYSTFAPFTAAGTPNHGDSNQLKAAVEHNRRAGTVDPTLEFNAVRFGAYASEYNGANKVKFLPDFKSALHASVGAWGNQFERADESEKNRAFRNISDIIRMMEPNELNQLKNCPEWKGIARQLKQFAQKRCDKDDVLLAILEDYGLGG